MQQAITLLDLQFQLWKNLDEADKAIKEYQTYDNDGNGHCHYMTCTLNCSGEEKSTILCQYLNKRLPLCEKYTC